MPIRQYKCPACGWERERLERVGALWGAPSCQKCLEQGKETIMERQLSAAGFRLKGEGNYGRGRV